MFLAWEVAGLPGGVSIRAIILATLLLVAGGARGEPLAIAEGDASDGIVTISLAGNATCSYAHCVAIGARDAHGGLAGVGGGDASGLVALAREGDAASTWCLAPVLCAAGVAVSPNRNASAAPACRADRGDAGGVVDGVGLAASSTSDSCAGGVAAGRDAEGSLAIAREGNARGRPVACIGARVNAAAYHPAGAPIANGVNVPFVCDGGVALAHAGDATSGVAICVAPEGACRSSWIALASGDAEARIAASRDGEARAGEGGVAASVAGPARTGEGTFQPGLLSASLLGDAEGAQVSASGYGRAAGELALSPFGSAHGSFAASGVGAASGQYAASLTGPADGYFVGASLLGDSSGQYAVSGTGRAEGSRVALSGCERLEERGVSALCLP